MLRTGAESALTLKGCCKANSLPTEVSGVTIIAFLSEVFSVECEEFWSRYVLYSRQIVTPNESESISVAGDDGIWRTIEFLLSVERVT
jgi:hypothetical protein